MQCGYRSLELSYHMLQSVIKNISINSDLDPATYDDLWPMAIIAPLWLMLIHRRLDQMTNAPLYLRPKQNTWHHYYDLIMGVMASQITSLMIVYSTVYSRHRSKKTSKLHLTDLSVGNSPVIGEFPAQKTSNTEMFPLDDVIMLCWQHFWMHFFYQNFNKFVPYLMVQLVINQHWLSEWLGTEQVISERSMNSIIKIHITVKHR